MTGSTAAAAILVATLFAAGASAQGLKDAGITALASLSTPRGAPRLPALPPLDSAAERRFAVRTALSFQAEPTDFLVNQPEIFRVAQSAFHFRSDYDWLRAEFGRDVRVLEAARLMSIDLGGQWRLESHCTVNFKGQPERMGAGLRLTLRR